MTMMKVSSSSALVEAENFSNSVEIFEEKRRGTEEKRERRLRERVAH